LLKSLTPREELAFFLKQRGGCWKEAGKLRQAAEAYGWGLAVAPHNKGVECCFGLCMNDWHEQLEKRKPPHFPALFAERPRERVFPETVPWRMEKDMRYLVVLEAMLEHRPYEERWWGPLRRGLRPIPCPVRADVHLDAQGFNVTMHYSETAMPPPREAQTVICPPFQPQTMTVWVLPAPLVLRKSRS